jgi:hypothetical protein
MPGNGREAHLEKIALADRSPSAELPSLLHLFTF